ncbi:hypothetical protein RR48_02417 [Papilio machaon]|uniref:Uncharacterized protein n=1 Tax=Papilio machaon TaxID=76193 RepID=A0A0N0PEL0_PAPMA|nr:hypothetical protein RR48_02417 [Papilio machaon]
MSARLRRCGGHRLVKRKSKSSIQSTISEDQPPAYKWDADKQTYDQICLSTELKMADGYTNHLQIEFTLL